MCSSHAPCCRPTDFEEEEDPANKSFFSEIISSISDVKFSRDGRYILSRDYLTLKIWDINMENRPVKTIPIHEHLRSKLCDLYENDCIFDKFESLWGHDNKKILTGSYNNYFHIFDKDDESDIVLQADKSAFKAKKMAGHKKGKGQHNNNNNNNANTNPAAGPINTDNIDFNKKILHASYHPRENTVAIAATNNLFIFSANNAA